ncbi:hypothetical protein CTAYLR_005168 [Chrysophaeum taylorii]|uniref:VCBS repeat-containing protein n=1 Tax=Chrysophaeum taylorii TaxID=2483200 RepID=A0AAD7XMF2_9STRA|nr:hypothetical protein CTAYLR_005168 [Chrysophaeum taylorii]
MLVVVLLSAAAATCPQTGVWSSGTSLVAGDVDGDESMDLVVASQDSDSVVWLSGGTEPHVVDTTAGHAACAWLGDLDGDAVSDIAAGLTSDQSLVYYAGPAWTRILVATLDGIHGCVGGDVDGDEDLDLVSAALGEDVQVAWHENDGTGGFTTHALMTSGAGAREVDLADVDGDDYQDVVVAATNDDKFLWFKQSSSSPGEFEMRELGSASHPRGVVAADVDADGDVDVVGASSHDDTIRIYVNQNNKNFSAIVLSDEADGARSVFAADVDGDANLELIASLYDANLVVRFDLDTYDAAVIAKITQPRDAIAVRGFNGNEGYDVFVGAPDAVTDAGCDQGLTAAPTYSSIKALGCSTTAIAGDAGAPVAAAVGDVDGDGIDDVVVAEPDNAMVAWYSDVSGEGYYTKSVAEASIDGVAAVAIGDVDGDGIDDIIAASPTIPMIAWFKTSLAKPTRNEIAGRAGAYAVFPVDVDGDEDIDVLAANSGDDDVVVLYENTGAGVIWEPKIVSSSALGVRAVAAADIDGDGDIDVLSASVRDGAIAWYENPSFARRVIAVVEAPLDIVVIDSDDDGDMDVIACFENSIVLYENGGSGSFSSVVITEEALGVVDLEAVFVDGTIQVLSAWWGANAVAMTSLADGETTIICDVVEGASCATAAKNSSSLDVFSCATSADAVYEHQCLQPTSKPSSPAPTRTPKPTSEVLSCSESVVTDDVVNPRTVAFADVDGDSSVDVVAGSLNDVAWYACSSSACTEHVVDSASGRTTAVLAADMDNDGDLDVVAASSSASTISWYECAGTDCTSQHFVSHGEAEGVHGIYVVDFDGDGDQDVLAALLGAGEVVLYDAPSWNATIIDPAADGPRSVAVADIDADGLNDVNSDGTFLKFVVDTDAQNVRKVITLDANNDGLLDIAAASPHDNTIAVYLHSIFAETHRFTKLVVTDEAGGATDVFALDVDGDDLPELFSAWFDDGVVAVHETTDGATYETTVVAANFDGAHAVVARLEYGSLVVAAAAEDDDLVATFTCGTTHLPTTSPKPTPHPSTPAPSLTDLPTPVPSTPAPSTSSPTGDNMHDGAR